MKNFALLISLLTTSSSFAGNWDIHTYHGTGIINYKDYDSKTYSGDCELTISTNTSEGKKGITLTIKNLTAFNSYYEHKDEYGHYSSILQENGNIPPTHLIGDATFNDDEISAHSETYVLGRLLYRHNIFIELDSLKPTSLSGVINKGSFLCKF